MHIILVAAWQFVTISLARSDEPLIPLEVSPSVSLSSATAFVTAALLCGR